MIDLIYCAGSNLRFSRIAYEAAWYLGIRSDKSPDGFPIHFVDVPYKQADFERHLAVVGKLQPQQDAVVPDLSETRIDELDIARAIRQAERLASYCQVVLIVPKLSGQLAFLPSCWAIGYSVPTSYGGAQYPLWELAGRRVHILGGSPHRQMEVYRYIQALGTVLSADGNMAMKLATRYAMYWEHGRWLKHPHYHQGARDLYLDCLRRSLQNIRQAWMTLERKDAL